MPYFGQYRLSGIQEVDIVEFINKKSLYSYSQLHKLKIILNSIFESAITNHKLSVNLAKKIKLPRPQMTPRKKGPTPIIRARYLIDFAKTHRFGSDIIILLKTGLRRSELLALQWENVDFENKLIRITESVSQAANEIEYNTCKTKKSIRGIPFDDELEQVIKDMPKRTVINSRKTIEADHDYVISGRYNRRFVLTTGPIKDILFSWMLLNNIA